jgi:hypothetical protein
MRDVADQLDADIADLEASVARIRSDVTAKKGQPDAPRQAGSSVP